MAAELLPALALQLAATPADFVEREGVFPLEVLAEDHLGHRHGAGEGVGHLAVVDALVGVYGAQLGAFAVARGARTASIGAEVVVVVA
jgi:hypothetical protein